MNREKLTLIILTILLLTFTAALDIYVFYGLEALDYLGAFVMLFLNVATMTMIYILYMYIFKKQMRAISHE